MSEGENLCCLLAGLKRGMVLSHILVPGEGGFKYGWEERRQLRRISLLAEKPAASSEAG